MNEDQTLNCISEQEQQSVEKEVGEVEQVIAQNNVLPADLIAAVKEQVTAEIVAEMKEDKAFEAKERQIRREQEDLERQEYIAKMKASEDPWVDFVGTVRETEHGQRIELEWNDAFIDYLRASGLMGSSDEQIVQQYITLLLRDMTDQYEERFGTDLA